MRNEIVVASSASPQNSPARKPSTQPHNLSQNGIASTASADATPTRKRRGLVAPAKPVTPQKSNGTSAADTPESITSMMRLRNARDKSSDHLTPVKKATKSLADEIEAGEQSRIMTRGRQRLQLDEDLNGEDEAEEDEDGSDEAEEEEQEEQEDEDEEQVVEDSRARLADHIVSVSYSNYFEHSARKKSKTSNNTLSKLPQLTLQEATAILSGIPDRHEKEIKLLHESHRGRFAQWKFEVDNGYNILLYGYGSKRRVIEDFGREMLAEDMSVLVINGYFTVLSLDAILVQILKQIAPEIPSTGDKLSLIQTHLSERLAILIHSLDSPILRLPKNQQILSTLSSNAYITMIASLDHVHAPLLFDTLKASRYNFLWHDCATFVPYRTELSFEESTYLGGGSSATSAVGGLPGIKAVLNNLTVNARSLYLLLLQHQLPLHPDNNDPASQERGISFSNLRNLCGKKILPLGNPTTLRGLLGEFFDHGLIVRNDGRGIASGRKGKGAGEILWAPFGRVVVSQVIEFLGGEISA
jgi:origin recognition complex subunit 2